MKTSLVAKLPAKHPGILNQAVSRPKIELQEMLTYAYEKDKNIFDVVFKRVWTFGLPSAGVRHSRHEWESVSLVVCEIYEISALNMEVSWVINHLVCHYIVQLLYILYSTYIYYIVQLLYIYIYIINICYLQQNLRIRHWCPVLHKWCENLLCNFENKVPHTAINFFTDLFDQVDALWMETISFLHL